ncbi:sulfate ABC transporter substrate-binding protein [Psychrobacter sp.]|uniref:sulfate ABC transporter substrate-binding protein n=1 Tax=Psychrobacter sp. TaxID=56811 RepID=UPI0025E87480|nr:sulfate ABC transporter substrate-binding protein [Psychrobacter sp.]
MANALKSNLLISLAAVSLALTGCGNQKQQGTVTNADGSTTTIENKDIQLLNVSYDISRDFYKEYNPLFVKHYKAEHPDSNIVISQSHGGSSKQALSVANGLQADVVTMNQVSDIELLQKKGLVANDWSKSFANDSVPFSSTTVFLVREGNPKQIKDWDDLAKPGVQIVIANPKVSGSGRYSFLGAYGYGLHKFNNDEAQTQAFMKKLLGNVKVYESGGRSATTTFAQRNMGDVLITFENEANLTANKFDKGQVQIVYPSYTIESETPVAVVNKVTDKKGTTQASTEYLKYLWSDEAQKLAATLYFRPSNETILAANSNKLPAIETFRANDVFGSWDDIMTKFFKEGGVFDQLSLNKANS